MSTQTTHLFLLEELEDVTKTRELAQGDLDALRSVADWMTIFAARPHRDIGRPGTVCPFVPDAPERKALLLALEQSAGQSVRDVVRLMNGYKKAAPGSRACRG